MHRSFCFDPLHSLRRLGGVAGFDRRRLVDAVVGGLAGRRALFYSGWSGVETSQLPANVFVLWDTRAGVATLAQNIELADRDQLRANARAMGERMRAEDGLTSAVRTIEHLMATTKH